MKHLICLTLMLFSVQVFSQTTFVKIENATGYSSYSRGLVPYKIKLSHQHGIMAGRDISKHIDISTGLIYQNSGAGTVFKYSTDEVPKEYFEVKQFYNSSFLKIPFEINLKFDRKIIYSIGFGMYYDLHLSSEFSTNSNEGLVHADNPSLDQMSNNDYGIRIRPMLSIPVSGKVKITTGVLQEFGFMELLLKTRRYSTSLFWGVRIDLGSQVNT